MLLDSEMRIKLILLEKEIAQIICYFPCLSCSSLCWLYKKKMVYASKQYFCHKRERNGGGVLWTTKLCRPILIIFILELFFKTSIDRQKTCILIQTPTNIRESSGLINSVHSSFYVSPNLTENRLNEFQGQKVKWGCDNPFWMF